MLELFLSSPSGEPTSFARFNAHETHRLVNWVRKCQPVAYPYPECPIDATGQPECWHRSAFGGGTSICYGHNREFEFLIVQGVRLDNSESGQLFDYLLAFV
jgi:hypothetical protein